MKGDLYQKGKLIAAGVEVRMIKGTSGTLTMPTTFNNLGQELELVYKSKRYSIILTGNLQGWPGDPVPFKVLGPGSSV